jgi:hypothetical protein
MSSTHPASVYNGQQPRRLSDLPKEVIVMIAKHTDDASSISSLRRVSKYLSSVIPTWLISKTPFYIMPTYDIILRMAQLVQTQSANPSCDLGRVPAIIFENVGPIPPGDLGLSGDLMEEDHEVFSDDSDDEQPPWANTYVRFFDTCYIERKYTQLLRLFESSLQDFHGIKEMIQLPGFHNSRLAQEPASVEELRALVLLYKDHEPDDFADEMWNRRRAIFEPFRGRSDHTGANMFDRAVGAVLRNPKCKEKLKFYIETYSCYALADVDPSATPVPVSQLGDVLEINYVGHRMSELNAMKLDLGILHDQKINTAAHYAGLTHLSISGDGLGNQGSVHMGLLGGPLHSPDWSRLDTLHFEDTQQNDQSAAFLSQQKCTLKLHNVYWCGDSVQRFSKGSYIRGAKVVGIFVIEGYNQLAGGVWIVASDQSEANEIATENAEHCKPIRSDGVARFVQPGDVQRYMIKGGDLPFNKANVWADEWEL